MFLYMVMKPFLKDDFRFPFFFNRVTLPEIPAMSGIEDLLTNLPYIRCHTGYTKGTLDNLRTLYTRIFSYCYPSTLAHPLYNTITPYILCNAHRINITDAPVISGTVLAHRN
jgi:hypothetical protein